MTDLKHVQVNGIRFAYFEQGRGPTVLLLHGFPDTARTWDHAMGALANAGFRAVAPYMRGYTPTEAPTDREVTVEQLGLDALALIDALGDDGRAFLVGHDWGAAASYAAAAMQPDKIKKLVTVAIPHPRAIRPTPARLLTAKHFIVLRFKSAAQRVRRDNFAYIDDIYRLWSPAWNLPPGELHDIKACFSDPDSLDTALGYYRAASPIPPDFLKKAIAVDTLSIGGDSDPFVGEADYKRAARFFSGAYQSALIPGGHFLHRESPERFALLLIDFFKAP